MWNISHRKIMINALKAEGVAMDDTYIPVKIKERELLRILRHVMKDIKVLKNIYESPTWSPDTAKR